MNPQDAVDLSREAIKTCLMVGGPILAASLLIGLLVGVFQAMTQVQDQTVSFVPKVILMLLCLGLALPWFADQMLDFARTSFEKPMAGYSTGFATEDSHPSDESKIYYDRDPRTETQPVVDKTARQEEFRFPQEFR